VGIPNPNLTFSALGGSGASIDGSSFTGTVSSPQFVQNSTAATQAETDLQTLNTSAVAAGLNPTPGSPTVINNRLSLTANGQYVADLSSFSLSSGKILTLSGEASTTFIFDISGGWSMSGSGKIVLNGITPDEVLFNVTGTNQTVTASGSSVGSGILMALNSDITFDTPGGSWTGRLFSDGGHTITLFSEAKVIQPTGGGGPTAVPEPSSLAMVLGIGGLAGLGYGWRRRRSG
jgi:hypothetical protein